MADLMLAKKCPRRAALSIGPGVTKVGVLRRAAIDVLMALADKNFDGPVTEVDDLVKQALADKTGPMLETEKAAEEAKMSHFIKSYLVYEDHHYHKVVAKGFTKEIPFGTDRHHAAVHVLLDRGDVLEAVRFVYRRNEYISKITKRSDPRKLAENSPELLFLQKAGEMKAAELGLTKPVYGSLYYLCLKVGTGGDWKGIEMPFEERPGANIACYRFTPAEEARILDEYKDVKPDLKQEAEDKRYCKECPFDDLCHADFVKREMAILPTEPPAPINSIHLTDAQRKFVGFHSGECRVNAVAGSGKTTIVILRTIALMELGTEPSHILMLTFTDKAAAEMKARLIAYTTGDELAYENLRADEVEVSTFNAWGQHILDERYKDLGYTQPPALIDDVTKKDIIIHLLDHHPSLPIDYNNPFMSSPTHEGAVIQIMGIIDAFKAAHVETEAEAEKICGIALAPELLAIYKEYNEALIKRGLLDYEDQLRLLLELDKLGIFKEMPYEHICIDEFQDSNPNQIDIILRLASQAPNYKSLAVVGDVMQSIYAFRNATPENLANFDKYFPHMTDISMCDNFRSQKPIIDMANRIISRQGIKDAIIAHKTDNALEPEILMMDSPETETSCICKKIKERIAAGVQPADIAVLCRTKSELLKLRDALAADKTPTILRVPEVIGDGAYPKSIIALCKYLANDDKVSLRMYVRSLGEDPFDEGKVERIGERVRAKMRAAKTERKKLETFGELVREGDGDFLGKAFLEGVRGRDFERLEDLLTHCIKYEKYGTKELISLSQERSNSVNLLTVHSAKGLEWPVVFLSLKKFQTDPEEQRLLYVGVTRAKEELYVSYTDKQTPLISLLVK